MQIVVHACDNSWRRARHGRPPGWVLGKRQLPCLCLEDVVPCVGVGIRDFVGGHAHDGAVSAVHVLDFVNELSADQGPEEGDPRGSPCFATAERGERVADEVVDGENDGTLGAVSQNLNFAADTSSAWPENKRTTNITRMATKSAPPVGLNRPTSASMV